MVWPFSKKPSEQDKFNQTVTLIAAGFFKSSEIITGHLLKAWRDIGLDFNLDRQRQWGIAREMCWYWIGKLEYSLKFELQASNVDVTIANLSNATLKRHIEVFGENYIDVETFNWLQGHDFEALRDYRTPVTFEGHLPMPGEITELEGSPLNTLMRRLEWVVKWDMTGLDDHGWTPSQQLRLPYKDYLKVISSTDRTTQIDKLLNEHLEWKDLVVTWIGGPGMAMRDLPKEHNLVHLMEFAQPMDEKFRLRLH